MRATDAVFELFVLLALSGLLPFASVELPVGAEAREETRGRATLRSRIAARMQERGLTRKPVCFDMVGCFANSPLLASPSDVATRFLLYTRRNPTQPALLAYGDNGASLNASHLDPGRELKVIVHGFKGSGRDKGAIAGATAFLKRADVNVVLLDWERGAARRYPSAAANTELVGRQLGRLLLDLTEWGISPAKMHLIGHSLGAHVAAVASQALRGHNVTVGRITGLDPASPLFKHTGADETRRLDVGDAALVDVVHTDGSPVWTSGFGLLRPLGHVDFFPNGGREQPGCADGRGSVVVSLIEGTVNSSVACSHIRAWQLFLESISSDSDSCQFTAWPCAGGLPGFLQGHCFPVSCGESCAVMGLAANESRAAAGPLYLVTRATPPFCGTQLRATVSVSERTQRTRGLLHLSVAHGQASTSFKINCEFLDVFQGGRLLWGLAAAEWGSISPHGTPLLKTSLSYQSLSNDALVYFDKVSLHDQLGNSWHYCGKDTLLQENNTAFNLVNIEMSTKPCHVE